jgi:hypothetical protein
MKNKRNRGQRTEYGGQRSEDGKRQRAEVGEKQRSEVIRSDILGEKCYTIK